MIPFPVVMPCHVYKELPTPSLNFPLALLVGREELAEEFEMASFVLTSMKN